MPADSARQLQRFEDTMAKYYGEMERILYAAEIACGDTHHQFCYRVNDTQPCPFQGERIVASLPPLCHVYVFRRFFGNHVKQDDAGVREG